MKTMMVLLVLPAAALAQTAVPMEFPDGSQPFAPEALHQHVVGKVFTGKPADGNTWRLEYRHNGHAYVNTARGFSDSGKWRVEGSSLCIDWQRGTAGCSEARLKDDVLYVKRPSNGEVLPLTPK